jgi:hypothetical protein
MIVSSNAFVFSTSLLVVVFRYGFSIYKETSIFFLVYNLEQFLLSCILYAFPEHFTQFLYVVTYNLLIILSFRFNLETD